MRGFVTIERWGTYVRLVFHKTYQTRGKKSSEDFEKPRPHEEEGYYWERVFETRDQKASEAERCAIVRARSKVRELAFCNDWEYFFTGTIDGDKQDRYDLPGYIKDLGVWIGNYNKKYKTKLQYLLIPEQHKDGAYHIHGLLNGVAPQSLAKNEYNFLDVPYYRERFGFLSLSPIKSHEKVCSYVTKYITKEQGQTNIGFGKHRYYASRGLQKSVKMAGYWMESEDFDKLGRVYWNDFVGIYMQKGE